MSDRKLVLRTADQSRRADIEFDPDSTGSEIIQAAVETPQATIMDATAVATSNLTSTPGRYASMAEKCVTQILRPVTMPAASNHQKRFRSAAKLARCTKVNEVNAASRHKPTANKRSLGSCSTTRHEYTLIMGGISQRSR